MPDDIKLPEPYGHVYEYDTGFELHWSFYPDRWNGMPPTRTVPVYTADQLRAAVEADRTQRKEWLIELLRRAQPYVREAANSYYDGTDGASLRQSAAGLSKQIDAAIEAAHGIPAPKGGSDA